MGAWWVMGYDVWGVEDGWRDFFLSGLRRGGTVLGVVLAFYFMCTVTVLVGKSEARFVPLGLLSLLICSQSLLSNAMS